VHKDTCPPLHTLLQQLLLQQLLLQQLLLQQLLLQQLLLQQLLLQQLLLQQLPAKHHADSRVYVCDVYDAQRERDRDM